ncbi:hypothetical protein Dimus_003651 [Dionaea muscipula]
MVVTVWVEASGWLSSVVGDAAEVSSAPLLFSSIVEQQVVIGEMMEGGQGGGLDRRTPSPLGGGLMSPRPGGCRGSAMAVSSSNGGGRRRVVLL